MIKVKRAAEIRAERGLDFSKVTRLANACAEVRSKLDIVQRKPRKVWAKMKRSSDGRPALVLCVWAAILMIVSGDRVVQAQSGAGFATGSRLQVIITERTLRHIEERHWPDSPAQGAGKFYQGITEASLKELVREAVANGRARPNTNGRPGQIYEYDFGRPIGTTINGGPASRLRVVVSPRNQVITAFPF